MQGRTITRVLPRLAFPVHLCSTASIRNASNVTPRGQKSGKKKREVTVKGNERQNQTSSRKSKRWQNRQKSKPSRYVTLVVRTWGGLTSSRLRRMGPPRHDDEARNIGLNVAMAEALMSPRSPLQFAAHIVKSAGTIFPCEMHADVIRCAVDSIHQCTPDGSHSFDVAVETFFRLAAVSRPTHESVVAVAEFAAIDDDVERRAKHAASLLRFVLHTRSVVSYSVFFAIFQSFVEGLDYSAALVTLTLVHDMYKNLTPMDQAYWYERLMYAALVRREFNVFDAARLHKESLTLPTTTYGESIDLAYDTERGSYQAAVSTARALVRRSIPIEHFALASIIRAAGEQHDLRVVREFYAIFEKSLGGCVQKFKLSLSPSNTARAKSISKFSVRTYENAAIDPTHAIFHAFRMCGEAREAVSLVRRLHDQYDVQFSPLLYSVVSETCFKANLVALAASFRREIQHYFDKKQFTNKAM